MSADLRSTQLGQLSAPGRRPALVVVDVQRDFADPSVLGSWGLTDEAYASVDRAVTQVGQLVDTARSLNVPVVWVELGSDPRTPWKSSNWLRGGDYDAPMGSDEPCQIGTSGAEWFRMTPAEGELRVVKSVYSGFLGTTLEAQLRDLGYDWLTVVGLTSECCVAATAEDAMQLGWPVIVPRDAVSAYDVEVNKAALKQLELNVAVISDSAEVIDLWKQASS